LYVSAVNSPIVATSADAESAVAASFVGAADPFESLAQAATDTTIHKRAKCSILTAVTRRYASFHAAATTTPGKHPVSFRLAIVDTELEAGEGFELSAPRWSERLNERGALRISQA
jgi:hypothetical protein